MFQDLSSKKKAFKKGYSITELMVAVLFFGVVAVSLSVPVSNALYLNTSNADINAANSLARSYLQDLKDSWKIRSDFDDGEMIAIEEGYTGQGSYTVNADVQSIQSDSDGNVLVRRVNMVYKDSNDNVLCDISLDYNRPGNVNQSGM